MRTRKFFRVFFVLKSNSKNRISLSASPIGQWHDKNIGEPANFLQNLFLINFKTVEELT